MSSAEAYFKSICEDLSSKRHTYTLLFRSLHSLCRIYKTFIRHNYHKRLQAGSGSTQHTEPKACELFTCLNYYFDFLEMDIV